MSTQEWMRKYLKPAPPYDEKKWNAAIAVEHRTDGTMLLEPRGMLGEPRGFQHLEQIVGRWLDATTFEAMDGRRFEGPAPDSDGVREYGEVRLVEE